MDDSDADPLAHERPTGEREATEHPSPGGCTRIRGGGCAKPTSRDEDGDGFEKGVDCDDHDAFAFPGFPEKAMPVKCDVIDQDCDGEDWCPPDEDSDGFSPPLDCDDRDGVKSPRAVEIQCNGVDENCDGVDECDRDGDGRPSVYDCDDGDAEAYFGAVEKVCDGVDQDCDGADCCDNDEDGDGFPCRLDCDDERAEVYPGAPVPAGTCLGRDFDCDGVRDKFCGTK